MNRTGIVRDERYIEHITDDYHPENPNRLRSIYAMLQQKDMEGFFTEIPPRLATREELEMVHLPSYIDLIASTAGWQWEGYWRQLKRPCRERWIMPSPSSGPLAITLKRTAPWGSVYLTISL